MKRHIFYACFAMAMFAGQAVKGAMSGDEWTTSVWVTLAVFSFGLMIFFCTDEIVEAIRKPK